MCPRFTTSHLRALALFSHLTCSSSPPSSLFLCSPYQRRPPRLHRRPPPTLPHPRPRGSNHICCSPRTVSIFAPVKPFYLGEIGRWEPVKAGRIEMEVKGRSPWVYEKRLMGLMPNATAGRDRSPSVPLDLSFSSPAN